MTTTKTPMVMPTMAPVDSDEDEEDDAGEDVEDVAPV